MLCEREERLDKNQLIGSAYIAGDEFGKSGGGSGGGGGGGSGSTAIPSSGPVVRIGSEGSTTDTPGSVAPMTSTATTRPGMLICVVGESLSNPAVFDGTMCDYAIYPDLVKDGTDFVPLYGKTSWEVFKKVLKRHYLQLVQ
ncbi:hypothetical protein V5799_011861 [Amblyomma americanum]|uniref:Uncharacterized protein n=1 Tax=Amblyomma americanum TaxID=6943 RepID=A0AAQ4EFX4_AMBAM